MISTPSRPAVRGPSLPPILTCLLLVSLLLLSIGLGACSPPAEAPPPAPAEPAPPAPAPSEKADIVHDLSFEDAARHLVDVEATFPADPESEALELMMAVWTPGSYLVREYSRHVEGVRAFDPEGRELTVEKTTKNRWRIADAGSSVVVRYRVYARELTVRTNFVDADLAVLTGAATFLVPVGGEALSHEVRLRLPDTWPDSATALDPLGEHRYYAPDFDTLVDSPLVLGTLLRRPFDVDGVPHELVQAGDYSLWDNDRAAEDVARLTLEQTEFWGTIPYSRYLFLNVIAEAGGGLEHSNSTLMLTSRLQDGTEKGYRRWLGLVSHELFHTWNVKRLRPAALGPFDYENENYTRSLWIVEGLTSYYGPLLLRRADLYDDEAFLDGLSSTIERVESTPGRRVRSLAESSFDAWIKAYRPDENLDNTAINYYGKGRVVGFLLDAEIRYRTGGRQSLDPVMRAAYERFSGDRGFTPEDFRALVAEVAGEPLDDFFDRYVDGTEELDYDRALEWLGLRFKESKSSGDDEPSGWLGFVPSEGTDRLTVKAVPRDTPAWRHGLNVDDEILAVEDYRVDAGSWKKRLEHYPPGTEATLWISRRGRLRRLPVTFEEEPERSWVLEIDEQAGSRGRLRRKAWLDG